MAQTKIKAGLFEGIIGNGTDGYFLMSNGDGTMTWSSIIINPTIASIAYPGSVTAADPAGGETITVTGTGFKTGATVTVGGTAAPAVSYVSATQITFTTPAKAAGDYDIVVTNTDTGSATYINGISYNGIPSWTTAAGSLGTFASQETISTITLQATEPDAGTITFNITSGALPTGLSLTGANIDGTTTLETADTLYTFTVTATDDESQTTPRTFTITVQKEFISTDNFTINTYTGNGSTRSIEGKIGTAAAFNGSGSYITLPNSVTTGFNTSSNGFAISFFLFNSSLSGQILPFYLNNGVLIGIDKETSGNLRVLFRDNAGSKTFNVTNNLTTNTWQHIVITGDSTNGVIMYIDETNVGSTTWNGNHDTSQTGTNTIGHSSASATCRVDQFRIFNKALSSSEITTLYGESNTSLTKSTTDIFDDSSGVALYEFEKGAIDTGGDSGYIGRGGLFDGSSTYITVPATATSPFDATSENFSISAWINISAFQNDACIISKWGSTATNQSYYFGFQGSGNNNKLIVYEKNGSSNVQHNSSTVFSTDTWYHVAYVRTATETIIYINGVAETFSNANTINSGNSQPIIIGRQDGYSGTSFNGKIDQLRLFNKSLSSSEVTTLYGETSASTTKSTTDIFDDLSGKALYEFEKNANDTGLAQAFTGQSADFNGSSQINISSSSVFDTTSNFSVSLWVNRDTTSEVCLINKLGSTANGWFFSWNPSYGYWFVNYNGGASGSTRQNGPTDSSGEWTHLVLTWNASTYTPKLYINGVSPSSNITTSGTGGGTNSNNLEIGGSTSYAGMPYYNGQTDDVKWFSSVISDSDIAKLALNLDTTATPIAHWKLDGNANDSVGNYNGTWSGTAAYLGPAEVPKYNGTATNVSYAYDGTPTNVSFVGTSFAPDLVWIKQRTGTANNHQLYDSVRGATARLYPNLINAVATDPTGLTAFNNYGFTLGNSGNVNDSSSTFAAWTWKAASSNSTNTDGSITSTVRANQDAGFSIVKWTGNETANQTIGHGLGASPELAFIKQLDGTREWQAPLFNETAGDYLILNSNASKANDTSRWSTADSSVITVGAQPHTNGTGSPYIGYFFRSVDSYQKVGSYSGGSSGSGSVIVTGFKPRFLLVKCTTASTAEDWIMLDNIRGGGDTFQNHLRANTNEVESTFNRQVTFVNNGFYWGQTDAAVNSSGRNYIYLAIA